MTRHRRRPPPFARLIALPLTCLSLAVALASTPAWADCADTAAPNVNWRRCFFDGRDLRGVNLNGAMLRDAGFTRARMDGADLTDSDAYRAKFFSAKLSGVRFDGTRLIEADFTRADLSGASFKGADLRNAKLVDADLKGADFTDARLGGTDLRQADLSGALWTDGKRICGENSIGQCN